MIAVNYVGTDDAGYNAVGAPWSRLTIPAALADLLANYPAASATNPLVVAIGPGTFTLPATALLPNYFLQGTADNEGRLLTTIILTGALTLDSTWAAGAATAGLSDMIIVAEGADLNFVMPAPSSGNPARGILLENFQTNVDTLNFQATGTGDYIAIDQVRQTGSSVATFTSGTIKLNNFISPSVTVASGAVLAATVNGVANSLTALILTKGAAALSATFDAVSVPLRANLTLNGGAVLTLANDARGEAYSPTTPGDWTPTVPTTVQQGLDLLGAAAGGGGTGTFAYIVRTGNRSSAAWGTAGCAINDTINTFTDTTSAGVVPGVTATRSFGIPTFASAGGVIYADAVNVYIAGPPTITGGAATDSWSLYVAAGNVRLTTGGMYFGAVTPANISGAAGTLTATMVGTGKFAGVSADTATTTTVGTFFAPALGTNGAIGTGALLGVGVAAATGNAAYLGLSYTASGSGANLGFLALHGGSAALAFTINGQILVGNLGTIGTGVLQFPAATTSAGGITFGADWSAFRASATEFRFGVNYSGTATATPSLFRLDSTYANTTTPTNQQLKLSLITVSATEGYGFAVGSDASLWYHAGNSAGATGSHKFATAGTTALTLDSSQHAVFGGRIIAAASAYIAWVGRSTLASSADGLILIANGAQSDFSRLQFGGTTASFPSIKRSGAELIARLADDSAVTYIQAKLRASNGTAGANFGPALPTSITVVDGVVTAAS